MRIHHWFLECRLTPVLQPGKEHRKRPAEIVSNYNKRTSELLSLDIINNFAVLKCHVTEKLKDFLARN